MALLEERASRLAPHRPPPQTEQGGAASSHRVVEGRSLSGRRTEGDLPATKARHRWRRAMIALDTDTLTLLLAEHPQVAERRRRETDEVVVTIVTQVETLLGRFATLLKAADGAELQRGQ